MMTKEEIQKVAQMLASGDEEMMELGASLFTFLSNNYEDYCKVRWQFIQLKHSTNPHPADDILTNMFRNIDIHTVWSYSAKLSRERQLNITHIKNQKENL